MSADDKPQACAPAAQEPSFAAVDEAFKAFVAKIKLDPRVIHGESRPREGKPASE